MVTLLLHSGARLSVHRLCHEAFRALDCVMQAHRYHLRAPDTGGYNCRRITGGNRYSLHAYGIAGDFNWNSNPYREELVTDMPPAMIVGIKRIRTMEGVAIFRWGGDFLSVKDAMHYEIVCSPDELGRRVDWGTVEMPPMDPSRPDTFPVVQPGDRGPHVSRLQTLLGLGADGIAGEETEAAIRNYQRMHGLVVDGICGLQMWTAFLTAQPVVRENEPSPIKLHVKPEVVAPTRMPPAPALPNPSPVAPWWRRILPRAPR
jgi:hypothetical protein